jgi:hypothetical protein
MSLLQVELELFREVDDLVVRIRRSWVIGRRRIVTNRAESRNGKHIAIEGDDQFGLHALTMHPIITFVP